MTPKEFNIFIQHGIMPELCKIGLRYLTNPEDSTTFIDNNSVLLANTMIIDDINLQKSTYGILYCLFDNNDMQEIIISLLIKKKVVAALALHDEKLTLDFTIGMCKRIKLFGINIFYDTLSELYKEGAL